MPTSESRLYILFVIYGAFSWRADDDLGDSQVAHLPQDCIVLLPSHVAVPAVLGYGQKTNKQTKMLCGFRADGRTQNFKVT